MTLPTEKQASLLRKYIMEFIVINLCIAVVYLFGLYHSQNRFINETMAKQNAEMIKVIERNTFIIQNVVK